MTQHSRRTRAVLSGTAAIALLGGGIAYAAGPGGPGGAPGGGPKQAPGTQLPQGVLHGSFVRSTTSGTEIDDLQNGSVTAVSATSITVTSKDSFVGTYVVTSATKVRRGPRSTDTSLPAVGDKVTVLAVEGDGSSTAKTISIRTAPAKPTASPSASASAAAPAARQG